MAPYETVESYRVFVRNWWRWERSSVTGERRRVPNPGARKTTLARGLTYAGARQMCHDYALTHEPGPLSRKAEFESEAR
jgi:hypothetical protein